MDIRNAADARRFVQAWGGAPAASERARWAFERNRDSQLACATIARVQKDADGERHHREASEVLSKALPVRA
jgi:hypothetical protein